MKVFNVGENNPAKKKDNRLKISKALKGRSKSFKDGKNLRRLNIKTTVNGYLLKWSDEYNKHVPEHRLIYEQSIGRQLNQNEQIHHIDGDKKNNNIENLVLCDNISEHSKLHDNIEKVFFKLVKAGIVNFNNKTKEYYLDPNIEIYTMEQSLNFKDVSFKQNENVCKTRADVDISSEIIKGIIRPLPFIASNMSTVTNADFCISLYNLGALGILHRAMPETEILKQINKISKQCEWVAGSIGLNDYNLVKKMIKSGCNIVCIDIAHGYNQDLIDLGKKIKLNFPDIKLILGNTINEDLLYKTYMFADAIKVGIAQGSVCETKNTAGCTSGQFSAVLRFKELSKKFEIPIISDGSIKEPSDCVKAIGAGASGVMMGRVFAMCPESNAPIENNKKIYAGMASRYVQENWRGKVSNGCPEGRKEYIDIGEPVNKLLLRYSGALKSGITYAGANDIKTFQNKIEFIKIW
jgi:IMP dehydrogenase/GMP reductase